MPRSWTQLQAHIVFSTKQRQLLIDERLCERLYPFLGGIARERGCSLLEVGGIPDHVQLLIRFRPSISISNLLPHLKTRSSAWIHEEFPQLRHFAWQAGYGAFSVSKSLTEEVAEYIRSQSEHHKTRDFVSEFVTMLNLHEVEYDEDEVYLG